MVVTLLRRFQMYSRVLGLTTTGFILAYGTVGAFAQSQTTPNQISNKRNRIRARKARARWAPA
jgi:hypothetical protein